MKPFHTACRGRIIEVKGGAYCQNCRRILQSTEVSSVRPFVDCITKIRYVGLNSEEDARELLEMMKG